MDKTTAGLLGAVAGLATMGVAQAATPAMADPSGALQAASYADLLAPVQNAVAVLRADDGARVNDAVPDGGIEPAQYYSYGPPPAYHRHHHHHHHYHHQAYNHHHHHHHQSSYVGIPGVGGVIIGNR